MSSFCGKSARVANLTAEEGVDGERGVPSTLMFAHLASHPGGRGQGWSQRGGGDRGGKKGWSKEIRTLETLLGGRIAPAGRRFHADVAVQKTREGGTTWRGGGRKLQISGHGVVFRGELVVC